MNSSRGQNKINLKAVRRHCLERGITVKQLAGIIGCSREAIYFAIERPERYGRVYGALQIHVTEGAAA